MRCLVRNKRPFYYALHKGQVELIDEYGNATGEYTISYDEPVMVLGNISAAQGEIQSRQFGEAESYDKVIVLDDKDTPIDEYTVLWVDTLPQPNEDTPYDYIVRKVARSLNSVSIAISKVSVNG